MTIVDSTSGPSGPRRHVSDGIPAPAPITHDSGQSLVEFAFALPIFLLIVTGIFTFGVAFSNWLVLTEANSVGARSVAISRLQTLDPCQTAVQAFTGAAPTLNPASVTFSFSFNGVVYNGPSCSSSSTLTGAAGNLVQGQSAQMTVTYPCSLQVFRANYVPNCQLHAQTTELVQ